MNMPLHSWWTLKKAAEELQELNEIPLLGKSPPFDWENFSSKLQEKLGAKGISVRPGRQHWIFPEQLSKEANSNRIVFPIDIAPLQEPAYWVMSELDTKKLTGSLFANAISAAPLGSQLLQEGFYRYLLLEAISAAATLDPLQTFTPILLEEASFPEEKVFAIDILISMQNQTCSGQLLIPNPLRLQWIRHFKDFPEARTASRLMQILEFSLIIKTGFVLLPKSGWEKISLGDFILLDAGSYDPRHGEGIASLNLGATPLFHVNIQKNSVELLRSALIYEDATDMPTHDDNPLDEAPLSPEETAQAAAIKEAPMYITVELARLRMPLEKLLQLSPGNLLELPIEPNQEVTLSVSGQKIGRGELVYIGERLGVSITAIG